MQKRNFKIFIIGDSLSGKSSLMHAYVGEQLPQNMIKASYGLDFRIIPYKSCMIQLWDTISIPKYFSITKTFLRSADAILICIPVNDPFAINRLDFYLKVLLEEEKSFDWGKRRVKIILTKCDLEIGFSWETMVEHLERWGLTFGKVSAIRGVGVKEEIEELLDDLNQDQEEGENNLEEKEKNEREKKEESKRKNEEENKESCKKVEEMKKKDYIKREGVRREEETEEEETVLSRRSSEEIEREPICHCF